MFDGSFRKPVDAAVKPIGAALRKTGLTPDHLTVVGLLIGAGAAELPSAFLDDRSRLYFGPDCDLDAIQADLPHLAAQLRSHFGLVEQGLTDGRPFLLGERFRSFCVAIVGMSTTRKAMVHTLCVWRFSRSNRHGN